MTQTSPLIPPSFRNKPLITLEQEVKDISDHIEWNLKEYSNTPFIAKKDFYAKRINELSARYKVLTGKYFVREER